MIAPNCPPFTAQRIACFAQLTDPIPFDGLAGFFFGSVLGAMDVGEPVPTSEVGENANYGFRSLP